MVRHLVRLLVMLGLVLSAASLAPLASAASSSPSPTATTSSADPSPTPSATTEQSDSGVVSPSSTSTPAPSSPGTNAVEPSQSASTSPAVVQPKAALKASSAETVGAPDVVPTPKLTHDGLERVTTWTAPRFSYSVDKPGMLFTCRIQGPHRAGTWRSCPGASDGATSSGSIKFKDLRPSRQGYTFTVYAYLPAGTDGVAAAQRGDGAKYRWHQFTPYAPNHRVIASGTSFNLPQGSKAHRRVSLTRVIRAVNSVPGYKEAYPGLCPGGDLIPGTIRISLYSLTDYPVARALIAARRRCVSVQVLMNNHLNRYNDPAWRALEHGLGTRRTRTGSFAHRCSFGCDGSGVLHLKMYLFDSTIRPTRMNRLRKTVLVGSSNMTSNAAGVQWNDLYGVKSNASLYNVYLRHFNSMARDNGFTRYKMQRAGRYDMAFSPYAPKGSDPEMSALRSVHCTGASGAGTHGHSLVYINMHAWFGTRGLKLADQVRRMYNRGCYVRVLYSFMSYGVFKKLKKGTGSRMSVRRTLFSHNGHTAYLYSHFKNISVSGYVGGSRGARVVWTGSNNFTNDGTHFDEVMMRIPYASAYRSYVNHFKYISSRKSSAIYANYSEPSGGGRAP